MTSHVFSGTTFGYDGYAIEIECDMSAGLPSLQIVGLGNKAIAEARERVRSAITNSGFTFPARRVTVNLAPADLPKFGTHFDLPIALAILVVSGQLRQNDTDGAMFAGELALDGTLRPIKGALHLAELATARGHTRLIMPRQNATQASLANHISVLGVASLQDTFKLLKGDMTVVQPHSAPSSSRSTAPTTKLDDVVGQQQAKRALIIAASGHHNVLLTGPPGSGKTMLANTLRNLLPEMSSDEIIATNKLYQLEAITNEDIITSRPFRAPHHSASRSSIIGGGIRLGPGEISLAHGGVLFLDELPEYSRDVLEALRQPLEDRSITLSRANAATTYPADFMLLATKNPCPCGYYGDPTHTCLCTSVAIAAYVGRISGPLLDRVDLVINVARVPHASFLRTTTQRSEHNSAKQSIEQARQRQSLRYGNEVTNAGLSSAQIKRYIPLDPEPAQLLLSAAERLDLSARAYFKVIRVARSIADLDGCETVTAAHIAEALHYRLPVSLEKGSPL